MKSQDQLKGLVEQSMAGISECRKRFQDLGDNPGPVDVRTVLDVATPRVQLVHLCSAELESVLEVLERVVIGACSSNPGKALCAELQETHEDSAGIESQPR